MCCSGDREDVANVGIIITDGESADPVAAAAEADRARREGIVLFAIGDVDNDALSTFIDL